MKNIDTLSKTTAGPDYAKIKKYGLIAAIVLVLCAGALVFFVTKGNNNVARTRGNSESYLAEDDGNYIDSIMLSEESIVLEIGESFLLNATVTPMERQQDIVWKSSDTKVATVEDNGRVEAVEPGIAAISVTSKDGYCSTKCQVIVQKTATGDSLSISESQISLAPGETKAISINKNGEEKQVFSAVKWKSSNDKVAKVASNGMVTALDYGTSVISAYSLENNSIIATCTVTVRATLESVTLEPKSLTLSVGASAKLTPDIKPDNCVNKSVTWESSNTAVATVDANGNVTAVKVGSAEITCTTKDGDQKASCKVTIQGKLEKLVISQSTMNMELNDRKNLSTTLWPDNIPDKTVEWKSSDPSVVSVDENGAIMAIGYGTATITATAKADANCHDTCTITVARKLTGVELNKTSETLLIGKTLRLSAKLIPENQDAHEITWSSSNSNVASVSKDGTVTAKDVGTALISCIVDDGTLTASCSVTVSMSVSSISFNHPVYSIALGEEYTEDLVYTVQPANAVTNVKCYSKDSSIVSVTDNKGLLKVRGLHCGESEIICEATDGSGVKASVKVYVNQNGFDAFTSTNAGTGTVQITGLKSSWQQSVSGSALVVPGLLDGKKVVSIADGAFDGKLSGITSVAIDENITSIGANAFANNDSLYSVTLPSTLTTIANGAFENCGIANITIPKKCTTIGDSAFKDCMALSSVTLSDSVKSIGANAFCNDINLTSITIPSSVTSIGEYAFYNSGLSSVSFKTQKLTTIPSYAFAMTNLSSVELPIGVKTINDGAFSGNAKLLTIKMPDSVQTLSGQPFANCTALQTIFVSSGLTSVSSSNFSGISSTTQFAILSMAVKTVLMDAGVSESQIIWIGG